MCLEQEESLKAMMELHRSTAKFRLTSTRATITSRKLERAGKARRGAGRVKTAAMVVASMLVAMNRRELGVSLIIYLEELLIH